MEERTAGEKMLPEPEQDAAYQVISCRKYLEKTTSGFLAQLVGVLSGYEYVENADGSPAVALPDDWFAICSGPYAAPNPYNRHESKLRLNRETGLWEVYNDDDYSIDILNQFILAESFRKYGTFSAKVVKDAWINYDVYDMGGGNRGDGAYALMKKKDYLPGFCGKAEFGNGHSWLTEPYIGNETLGMDAAGMPDVAADLADTFGGVTGDRDNVSWLKYYAEIYAMAYFEEDIPTLLRKAEVVFPMGCWQRKVIDEAFRLHGQYPDDWRMAVTQAVKRCYQGFFDGIGRSRDPRMFDSGIFAAFVVLGLLYGEGDYYETCKILSLAGQDGDCTAAVGLGVVGVRNGMKNLPPEVHEKIWQDGKGVVVNLPPSAETKPDVYMICAGLADRFLITDIVEMYRRNFEHLLLENGGRIENGNYYIPKRPLRRVETVLVEGFESGTFDGWNVVGNAQLAQPGFTGQYGVRADGCGTQGSGIWRMVSGLAPGAEYRMSAYVRADCGANARLFARKTGEAGTYATVDNCAIYVKRDLVFRAVSDKMEIGFYVPPGADGEIKAFIDDIAVVRVLEEKPLGDAVTVKYAEPDGSCTGKTEFLIAGTWNEEVYLKLIFSNPGSAILDVPMTVNGEKYATIPFSATGSMLDENAADSVYIPVILRGDVTVVSLNFKDATVIVRSAEIIKVKDRF